VTQIPTRNEYKLAVTSRGALRLFKKTISLFAFAVSALPNQLAAVCQFGFGESNFGD
jgi:hypothetical protein